jgi:hypothetical protein
MSRRPGVCADDNVIFGLWHANSSVRGAYGVWPIAQAGEAKSFWRMAYSTSGTKRFWLINLISDYEPSANAISY